MYALLSARTDECNSTDASQLFICNVCEMCLSKTNNISASVPIYSCHPIARSGAQFLKALQEKPEYICTCCHHLLFQRSVAWFHVRDFAMTHSVVNMCLSYWQKTCLDSTDEEYICIRCKNSCLWGKKLDA